jgi:serine/threonine protein kinase
MTGSKILHYKIIEKLGEGGMGIVYKAEDTKLNREVAIKLLPSHLLVSDEDKSRFQREAKAAAALNHPNIATVHEINEYESTPFIVMEYVKGKTLNDNLKDKPFGINEAISIAIQVADGLKAAHAKDIVHRDIKSGNVLFSDDGHAKILDFGLAKTSMSTQLTKMGSTLGTVAYMSPEQVNGKEVDHRTDLWSLGVVIFEMITGRYPFAGDYDQAIFYSILNEVPEPLTGLRTGVPMSLEWIVNKLMAKDPAKRYQSAKDLIIDLKAVDLNATDMSRITTAKSAYKPSLANKSETLIKATHWRRSVIWSVTFSIIISAFLIGFFISYYLEPTSEPLPTIKASINLPKKIKYMDDLGGNLAISPDGKLLAFSGIDSTSRTKLWIRKLNSNESKILPGTDKARYPFWSKDSRSIAFFADGELKKINAAGGPVLSLAPTPFGRGGAWSNKGVIIFSPAVTDRNLFAIPASGGTMQQLTEFDSTSKSVPRFPFFLPDGEHFLFSLLELEAKDPKTDVYLGSLGKFTPEKILGDAAHAVYRSGYLFFLRQGILMAQPFDPDKLSLMGDPVSLQGNINAWMPRAKADFSLSNNGILVYSSGSAFRLTDLIWINSDGSESSIINISNLLGRPVISPDETRIVYSEESEIWVYNIISKLKTRLTFTGPGNNFPIWSTDGSIIYYHADIAGNKTNIFAKRADGLGESELISRNDNASSVAYYPQDVSPDGRYLLIIESTGFTNAGELAIIDLNEAQRPIPIEKIGITATEARFSPNGDWLIFNSGASNENIFIRAFNNKIGKWQITEGGANNPFWLKERIIYWSKSSDRYESIKISFDSSVPNFSSPEPLFKNGLTSNRYIYGGTGGRDKFLALRPANSQSGNLISVVLNWKGLIEKDKYDR